MALSKPTTFVLDVELHDKFKTHCENKGFVMSKIVENKVREWMMAKKLYIIYYEGLWLGGKAVVRAQNRHTAYNYLAAENPPNLEPIEKVDIQEVPEDEKVIYNDDGNY